MSPQNIAIIVIFLLILIIVFRLYCPKKLFKTARNPLDIETFVSSMKNRTFLYPIAEKNWNRAHAAMIDDLTIHPYITFDRQYIANPQQVYFPKDLDEIRDIIIKNRGNKIRTAGGHHTFNDLSITNDTLIRTFNLKKILSLDPKKKQITVETGITLEDLCIYLEEHNLALHILPAIPYQTIGGCIATATHGSYLGSGTLSDAVRDMTVVLANGNVRRVEFDDPDFPAFATNLGCLGVMYSVTLQCVDLFAMEHIRQDTTWKEIKGSIPTMIEENPFIQIYVWPYSPNLKVTVYNRRKLDLGPRDLEQLKGIGYPGNIKQIKQAQGIYYRMLTRNEEAGYYTEEEVGIPIEKAAEAVDDVLRLFKTHEQLYGYHTKKPLLIRFTGPDYNSWMSMASGRATAWLDVYRELPLDAKRLSEDDTKRHLKFFRDFEDLLLYKYSGRPHWGKRNFMDLYKTRLVYGLSVDYFNRIRKRYDPEGMFSNDYIDRVLGD